MPGVEFITQLFESVTSYGAMFCVVYLCSLMGYYALQKSELPRIPVVTINMKIFTALPLIVFGFAGHQNVGKVYLQCITICSFFRYLTNCRRTTKLIILGLLSLVFTT